MEGIPICGHVVAELGVTIHELVKRSQLDEDPVELFAVETTHQLWTETLLLLLFEKFV